MEQSLIVEQSAEQARAWRPALTFTLLLSYFALFGTIIGGQGVLWAEVVRNLQLSKSTFGTAQLAAPLIAVVFLLIGGQLTSFAGKKRLAIVSLVLLGGSVVLLAAAGSLAGLVGSLLVAGAGAGLLELAMNGGTLDWEQATQRNVMNIMHAGFSGGAVLGALAAGALLAANWSYGAILGGMALLCGLALLATLPVRYPPADKGDAAQSDLSATFRLLTSQRALVAMALLSGLGIVGESVANLWSVIYLRELGATAVVGGAAFALFNGAMFVGRLLNAPLVTWRGARFSLLVSGVLLILANIVLFASGSVTVAVVAFVLLGLGVAGVVPTALTVAARLAPGNSGAITGAIMATTYSAFIVCPPLMGIIADLVSLRAALLSVGLSGLAILALAWGVERSRA